MDAHRKQLEWAKRRALAAAARRQRVALARADMIIGGVLLEAVFNQDWRRLAEWLAPRLDDRARARLGEPLPASDRARQRRLHWVLARTGRAVRTSGSAAQTAELLAAVRACLAAPRERALLDAAAAGADAETPDPQP